MPRIFCDAPLHQGGELRLPDGAARHVQVLRHQPGDELTLFNGQGGQWLAEVVLMGKSHVDVRVTRHEAVERELRHAVHLWVGLTANERMDWLVEKATELGVASITPVMAERSVLRLKGERAQRRVAHWQAIAQAACEQCGRNRVPVLHDVTTLPELLAAERPSWADANKAVLSLAEGTSAFAAWRAAREAQTNHASSAKAEGVDQPLEARAAWVFLSGPEGGLSAQEDGLARSQGMAPVQLGSRVLRAETAPLAVLSHFALQV